jgi:DNA primase
VLPSDNDTDTDLDAPRYLGMPGRKPLLGFDQARDASSVVATEGAFDLLTLRMWGYPSVALLGTHVSAHVIDQLQTFQRVYLALD